MLVIRFALKGKNKEPLFRIIISEKTKDTQGDYLEVLGSYNPKTKETKLNGERVKYWISKGATLSDTVNNLLITNKIITGEKRRKGRKAKKGAEEKKTEVTAPADLPDKTSNEEKKTEPAQSKTSEKKVNEAEPKK